MPPARGGDAAKRPGDDMPVQDLKWWWLGGAAFS
jgi:hypothetical protein